MGKSLTGKDLGKGISQRKDGRYEARCVVNGNSIRLFDNNLSELKKKFKIEKTHALANRVYSKGDIELSKWFCEWFEKYKSPTLKNAQSASVYERKVRNTYVAKLGDKKLNELKQTDFQEATNELITEGRSDKCIKNALSSIEQCMQDAVINEYIRSNPCANIKFKNRNVITERRVMSKKEQDIFLEATKNDYYYEAYKFLLLTGVRIGEFSALRWDDIDFENKRIFIKRSMSTYYLDKKKTEEITTPKTESAYRQIPFFAGVEEALISWKAKQDRYKKKLGKHWRADEKFGDLIFTSTQGSPVTRYILSPRINSIVNSINLIERQRADMECREPIYFEHLHPHAFRHTFATRCHEKKLDPLLIQKIMGHSNYATTLSYTHILDDYKSEELMKIDLSI